ncbi:MAG: MG2 domain-containing protein [Tepidisphaeraceae bacterium]|jgi:uncharacterized protein YfaS (alpha-2-macroglobulin family)
MSAFRAVAAGAIGAMVVAAFVVAGQNNAQGVADGRYLGHLSTDKPIYRAGERVYLRGVILGALDHVPLAADGSGYAMLQITGPKGEQLFSQGTQVQDSVAGFNWDVPADASGGRYTATMSFPANGFPPTKREFEVRAFRAPRLKGEIVFLRDGFGPGDTVRASLHVERAEGGLPAGAKVSASAIVDGKNAYSGQTTVDSAGNCAVEFALPTRIERGDGTLSLAVADGGVIEPIAKTIPILLNTVDISIYPEGGDLVAGLPCRVYVEARTPAQKPADLVGEVIDSRGNAVANVTTEHEGRGRFLLTPEEGQTYAIKLSQPSGITRSFPLPNVKASGVVLRSTTDVTGGADAVKLEIAATAAGSYTVTLSKRQTEVASTGVKIIPGQTAQVALTPPGWADGVLVATVKDAQGTPVAERLIFRNSAKALHVKVTTDRSAYTPADAVTVTLSTTDDAGRPVAAVVGVTATDQAVLRMPEKRDRAPRLGAMVLLEDDVRELADAEIYLDPNDPKANLATDLLLGTQGWRRFATVDSPKFLEAYGDAARRVLGDVQPVIQTYRAVGGFGGGVMDENRLGRIAPGDAVFALAAPRAAAIGRPEVQPPANVPMDAQVQLDDKRLLPFAARSKLGQNVLPAEVMRVYAHDLRPDRASDDRIDFAETVYWSAGVKTDEKTGTATVTFHLNDSVTSFDVTADAFDASGELGDGNATITASQPFYVEPKLPLEVSSGDVIHLPIAAVNGTQNTLDNVTFTLTGGQGMSISPVDTFSLPAGLRIRRLVDVHIGEVPGTWDFVLQAQAGSFSDRVTRTLVVKPLGFPTEIAKGGLLNAGSRVVHVIRVPDSLVSGSVKTSAALYPTPLANLTEALQRLLQEPYGCFEQTSSTTYPLVMADQYFTTHSGIDPALISRSNELLDKGYARLRGFECQNKGYEWFGEDPGHECLTAYGLLEFTDMSAVRTVDPVMLQNTRKWLLARRDGKGGFTHERRALHTWIADPGCANGYCTWALLETGQTGLDAEVKWLAEHAQADSNSYVKALAANALFLAGDRAGAKQFMDQLANLQDKDGHVRGATTTVVGSGGESLEIETTSLATLAWLRDPAYAGNVEQSIRYLADSCQAGRYGSTQSTVLALRAIVAYDKARAHPTAAGKVQLFVDNQSVGDAMAFDATTTGAIKLPDFSQKLTPGEHSVELRMTDGSDLPYAVTVSFNSVTPASSDQCKLTMTTALAEDHVTEGDATEARVTLTSRAADTLPTPIAIVGLPGGLEVRHDQLKELVKAGRIAAYEVRGREVVLYWRDIQPNQTIEVPLSLMAAIPGEYTGPASRTYLYYTDEFKQWLPGMKVTVAAK